MCVETSTVFLRWYSGFPQSSQRRPGTFLDYVLTFCAPHFLAVPRTRTGAGSASTLTLMLAKLFAVPWYASLLFMSCLNLQCKLKSTQFYITIITVKCLCKWMNMVCFYSSVDISNRQSVQINISLKTFEIRFDIWNDPNKY